MTELLIVGGLTIDHFADGSRAPGGTVLHAGRAAVEDGVRPAILTVAGDEPEAVDGLHQLAALGRLVHQPSPRTTAFGHAEAQGRRVLTYRASSAPIAAPADLPALDVTLIAPIAHELPPASLENLLPAIAPGLAVMLIQGWLRRLVPDEPVVPLPLADLDPDLWAAFGSADAVVVSTEDLAEDPDDPFAQTAALRERLGNRPVIVVTLGADGFVLDDPAVDRIVASLPRRVVSGVPTVGAGDVFGLGLAIHLGRGLPPHGAANAAAESVIRVLEARRP